MNKIEPVDIEDGLFNKPFGVKVNGEYLLDVRRRIRRFKDSFTAAVAGATEVDKRRSQKVKL